MPRSQDQNPIVYPFYDFHISQASVDRELPRPTLACSFTLSFRNNSDRSLNSPLASVTFSVSPDLMQFYPVRNPKLFFDSMRSGVPYVVYKGFTYGPDLYRLDAGCRTLLDFLAGLVDIHTDYAMAFAKPGKVPKLFDGKAINLNQDPLIVKLLELAADVGFDLDLTKIQPQMPVVRIQALHPTASGLLDMPIQILRDTRFTRYPLYRLYYDTRRFPIPLTSDCTYVFFDGAILPLTLEHSRTLMGLYNSLLTFRESIGISGEQLPHFMNRVYPALSGLFPVVLDAPLKSLVIDAPLLPCLYLDRYETGISVKILFKYDSYQFNPLLGPAEGGPILIRNMVGEGLVLDYFTSFSIDDGRYICQDPDQLFHFFEESLPRLAKLAELYYSDDFKKLQPFAPRIAVHLGLEKGAMLAFEFDVDGISYGELSKVFKAIRLKKRYYRLREGAFLDLDQVDLLSLFDLVENLPISKDELAKGSALLPAYHALTIEALLDGGGTTVDQRMDVGKSTLYLGFVEDLKQLKSAGLSDFKSKAGHHPLSPRYQSLLRDYQKLGVAWLHAIADYGLGGILADDMGLGKTLQAIAFIESDYKRSRAPALVIAPTSLIYNWESEVHRFAPDLPVLVVSGTPADRERLLRDIHNYALVITSYPLLRRDIHLYNRVIYSSCFLDEAQHIKNPLSLAAEAVKSIKAECRFALTGTPVENHLSELWSLFDFIMPGFFPPLRSFLGKYEKPIAMHDDLILGRLKDLIEPFLLRRLKRDVLKELPAKIETISYAVLDPDQKRLYLAYLAEVKERLRTDLATEGFNKSQVKILAYLTRLRQICCHPAMFVEDYLGDSGKLTLLLELVEDAVAAGHKILVFSQFTTMLGLIREALAAADITYSYLDGAVAARMRKTLVDDFNTGPNQVFLISLKAGGTGLNLTGADVVIHADPWWNPAVEDQATDRAYRIGQKNRVQVIRLITQGTIEEKIDALKQKKRLLSKALIDGIGETAFLPNLTEAEVLELF